MYGLIILTVKSLVITKFGEDTWKKLCKEVSVPENYETVQRYEDEVLYKLVGGISNLTKLTPAEVVEAAGYWFVVYVRTTDYGKLFSIVGSTLADTLKNINSLHGHLKVTGFTEATFPTFRTIPVDDCHLKIQYTPGHPSRVGLGPLVVGLIKGVAEIVHQVTNITVAQSKIRGKGSSYDEYVVKWTPTDTTEDDDSSSLSMTERPSIGIDGKALMQIHPFHIAFNKKMEITQAGSSINKVVGIDFEKPDMGLYFVYIEPKNAKIDSFNAARTAWKNKETVILAHNSPNVSNFRLKGEFAYVRKKGLMFFIGTPLIQSVEEAIKFKLSLPDFAVHDPVKDVIFHDVQSFAINQQQQGKAAEVEAKSHVTFAKDNKDNNNNKDNKDNKDLKDSKEKDNSGIRKKNVLQSLFGSKIPKNDKVEPRTNAGGERIVPSSSYNNLSPSSSLVNLNGSPPPSNVPPLSMGEIRKSASAAGLNPEKAASKCPFSSAMSPPSSPRAAGPTSLLAATPEPSPRCDRLGRKFHEILLDDACQGFPVTIELLKHFHTSEEVYCEDFYLAIVKYFASRDNRHLSLFRVVMDQELIEGTVSSTSLFREESVGVRLWGVIAEFEGLNYFRKLILQIHRVIDKYDVEEEAKQKMTPGLAAKLIDCGTQILNIIEGAADDCPPALRIALNCVYKRLEKKYPGMPFKGVCTLFFLRGLFPGVLRPEKFLLSMSLTKPKTTITVIKMLQNLINGVEYDGTKEAQMAPLNDFIVSAESQRALSSFLELVLTTTPMKREQPKDTTLSMSIIRDVLVARLPSLMTASSPTVQNFFITLLSVGLSSLQ